MFDFVCTNVLSFGSRLIPVTGQAGAGQVYMSILRHIMLSYWLAERERRGEERRRRRIRRRRER